MKVRRNLLIAFSLLSLSVNAQRIKGSDTVLPVAQQTAERFMNQHPDARVRIRESPPVHRRDRCR